MIANGDVQAFSVFYNRYSPSVFNAAMSFTKGDHSLSEEIVQVVFIRIWEHRAKLVALQSPENYLFMLARNLIFDIFQDRAREHTRRQQLGALPENEQDSPVSLLAAREYSTIFKKAIASLSPQQKMIYELAKEEGISHADIAARTGLTVNTVRTHLKLATRAVRQYVSNYIDEPDYLMVIFFMACSQAVQQV